jgi:hypothetical protein
MPSKTFAGISAPIHLQTAPVMAAEPVHVSAVNGKHRQRARTVKGQFQGDDPATPDVDEAWVE